MSAIFKKVEFEWRGKRYELTPTYGIINTIEQRHSIHGIVSRTMRGDPPMSHIAFVLSVLLESAGAEGASPEEVYADIALANVTQMKAIVEVLVDAFIPQGNSGSSAAQPAAAGEASKKE